MACVCRILRASASKSCNSWSSRLRYGVEFLSYDEVENKIRAAKQQQQQQQETVLSLPLWNRSSSKQIFEDSARTSKKTKCLSFPKINFFEETIPANYTENINIKYGVIYC